MSSDLGHRARNKAQNVCMLVTKWIFVIAACILSLFVLLVLVAYIRQRKLYYQPKTPRRGPTPANIGLRHWNVKIEERIDTWWIPASPGMSTVMICHGNAGNISHRLPLISVIRQTGMGVVIFDYTGYGNTAGKPSERAIREDALAVWDWMCRRFPPKDIIVLGRSLGGGVACELVHSLILRSASLRKRPASEGIDLPKALVLDSTFTSMPQACTHNLPKALRFMGKLVKDKYDTVHKIKLAASRVPTVLLHTLKDRTVPLWQARKNAEVGKCSLVILPRGGHNDGYMRSSSTYQRVLLALQAMA